jgi:hypothetical protein
MVPGGGPVLRVGGREPVTFHLARRPECVELWRSDGRRAALRAGRAIAWRAGPPGDYQMSTRYLGGDITYLFRLRPRSPFGVVVQ